MTGSSKNYPDNAPMVLSPPPDLLTIPDAALFLDFDGTLVDIASRPDKIRLPVHLPALLARLAQRLDGRIALVSGRALADIDQHLGHIGITVAGSHGGEWRRAGSTQTRIMPGTHYAPESITAALQTVNDFFRASHGVMVESKPMGFAVHYRNQPEAAAAADDLVAALARSMGMQVKQGNMVVELLPAGTGKGHAVRECMKMPEFQGGRPVFLGDDITDEDAFSAVREYPDGGGVLVGNMRPTAAIWQLPGVSDVHAWLERALA